MVGGGGRLGGVGGGRCGVGRGGVGVLCFGNLHSDAPNCIYNPKIQLKMTIS